MRVVLIVLASILGAYLLLFIINLIFVGAFSSIMKKHNKSLSINLSSLYDSLNSLVNLLKEYNIKNTEELEEKLRNIDVKSFQDQSSEECQTNKKDLTYIRTALVALAEENKDLVKDERYISLKETIEQLVAVYRSDVIMYNADVLGYNYWIRFLPFRYVFLLCKTKTKDIIS